MKMTQQRADRNRSRHREMSSTERFDAVVVGAGIMGSCAAFELSRRGCSVVLLDQFDLLHHLGSSHGESRTIRSTYPEAFYTPMALTSLRLWLAAESLAGYRVLTPTRHLDMGPSDSLPLQLAISNSRAHSVPIRVLDPSQLAAEFSGAFRIPEGWIGAISDHAGVIKPTKAVAMFHALAKSHGAILRDHMKVVDIRRSDVDRTNLVVHTEKGVDFHAGKVVVTTGAWTRKLLKELQLPITPIHVILYYWKIRDGHEKELVPEGGFPTFASYGDHFIYGTPSMEFPGLIKVAPHEGKKCDPDNRCWFSDETAAGDAVGHFVEQVMGGKVEAERPAMTHTCMYSVTPDADYIIDYAGGELGRDVVVATGFSGHGFKMGPLIGKVVAEMALGEEVVDVDLRHFQARRFQSNAGGNKKDHPNVLV